MTTLLAITVEEASMKFMDKKVSSYKFINKNNKLLTILGMVLLACRSSIWSYQMN